MTIPTEPIGSIPRPLKLLDAINRHGSSHPSLESALPALALTAYARSEDRTKAINSGFQNDLAKPVEPAELLAVVSSLAGRKVTMPPVAR